MRFWMCFVLLAQCLQLIGGARPRVFFRENFRQYKNVPATCVKGVGIKTLNDPIWSMTAGARCELTKDSRIFANPISLRGADSAQALFKFLPNNKQSEFELVFTTVSGGKIAIRFNVDGVSARFTKAGINVSKKFESELPIRKWRIAAVTIAAGELSVYVDKERAYQKALAVKIPSVKLKSANFHGLLCKRQSAPAIIFTFFFLTLQCLI